MAHFLKYLGILGCPLGFQRRGLQSWLEAPCTRPWSTDREIWVNHFSAETQKVAFLDLPFSGSRPEHGSVRGREGKELPASVETFLYTYLLLCQRAPYPQLCQLSPEPVTLGFTLSREEATTEMVGRKHPAVQRGEGLMMEFPPAAPPACLHPNILVPVISEVCVRACKCV